MIDLSGKTAIVTGASRGIGRACAVRLAGLGATVVVNYLNSTEGASATVSIIQQNGGNAIAIRADVSSRDDIVGLVDYTHDRFGSVDIVISNAAAGGFKPTSEVTTLNFQSVMQHNTLPLLWLAQAVSAKPRGESVIKFTAISSHGSQRIVPNYGAIGISKAAIEALVRQLSYELGPQGMNFNTVLSGMVETQAVASMPDMANILKSAQELMLVKRKQLRPEDIADVVAFLSSPSSDMIQGQVIVVDGGVMNRV